MASSRSSFDCLAWFPRASVFAEFERCRREVAPLLCADCSRFLASSPRLSRYLRNSSTPSSTLRMRSATCPLANGAVWACVNVERPIAANIDAQQSVVVLLQLIAHPPFKLELMSAIILHVNLRKLSPGGRRTCLLEQD